MVNRICKVCAKNYQKYTKTCSWECRNKIIGDLYRGKKLSSEHRRKISENHADVSGKNNPKWGGGKRISLGYIHVLSPEHPNKTNNG